MKITSVEKAQQLFSQKYHCSQAVLAAFANKLGLDEMQALKLGACFGGGMCKGEIYGACTGALLALGLKYGQCEIGDWASRSKAIAMAERFLDTFRKENGSYICKELLECDLATTDGRAYARSQALFDRICPRLVESAARIAEALLGD